MVDTLQNVRVVDRVRNGATAECLMIHCWSEWGSRAEWCALLSVMMQATHNGHEDLKQLYGTGYTQIVSVDGYIQFPFTSLKDQLLVWYRTEEAWKTFTINCRCHPRQSSPLNGLPCHLWRSAMLICKVLTCQSKLKRLVVASSARKPPGRMDSTIQSGQYGELWRRSWNRTGNCATCGSRTRFVRCSPSTTSCDRTHQLCYLVRCLHRGREVNP